MIRTSPISLALTSLFGAVLLLGASCGAPKDGGVFRSLDSAENWEQKVFIAQEGRRTRTINELNVATLAFHPTDANIIYLGSKGSGLYLTVTGGEQWTQSTTITSGTINSIAIDPQDPRNVYIAKDSTILKSTDEGITWETVYADVDGSTITTLMVDSFEHNRLYAGTAGGVVLKSYDYGINWDLRLQIEEGISKLVMAKHDTRIIYALTKEYDLYKTTTGGEVTDGAIAEEINSGWTQMFDKEFKDKFNDGEKVTDIIIDPNDSTVVYTVTRRGLMRGADNASSWSDIVTLIGVGDKQSEQIKNLTISPGNSQELYFSIGKSIHKSTDGGTSWKIIENFPSTRSITALLIDYQTPNVIYAGTQETEKKGGLLKAN